MQNEKIVKYGNRSRVGILLNSQNKKLLNYQKMLQQEVKAKRNTSQNVSDFNKSKISDLANFRQKFK